MYVLPLEKARKRDEKKGPVRKQEDENVFFGGELRDGRKGGGN